VTPVAGFVPQAPDWEARVRDSFARQPAMALVGARLERVAPGEVMIALTVESKITQQHGYAHGGVVGMIADSAGGYAGFSLMPADATVLTVEYKMNLLAPAEGPELVARGRVVKTGRTLVVTEADVVNRREDGSETICARMLQTLMTLRGRPDAPPPRG
jgi:uncharacterized protein (TIGR00369 family)